MLTNFIVCIENISQTNRKGWMLKTLQSSDLGVFDQSFEQDSK
jgi:hypothetical protein